MTTFIVFDTKSDPVAVVQAASQGDALNFACRVLSTSNLEIEEMTSTVYILSRAKHPITGDFVVQRLGNKWYASVVSDHGRLVQVNEHGVHDIEDAFNDVRRCSGRPIPYVWTMDGLVPKRVHGFDWNP